MAPVPLETMRGWFETACRPTGLRQLVGRQVLDSLLSDRLGPGAVGDNEGLVYWPHGVGSDEVFGTAYWRGVKELV